MINLERLSFEAIELPAFGYQDIRSAANLPWQEDVRVVWVDRRVQASQYLNEGHRASTMQAPIALGKLRQIGVRAPPRFVA